MAHSSERSRAAIIFAALSASGGVLLAVYIFKRVRELKSQKFPNGIAGAIKNEHLAVLAKSANVSLRQSAEQMLLDRILEKDAFEEVISGCASKDENELYRACSVFCVVLKSVNFSIPLPLSEISQMLTSCLKRSMDREKHFEVRSEDSVYAVKIQRMTLATICDFLSNSISNKDVLIGTCPDIIPTCIRLVDESTNKEVLRYSVLLLYQIAGLGTTQEVREAGAIAVLAKRILTFHHEQIMQRITLQTIVILIGSVDDSKALCEEIATPRVLMPIVSSCTSEDVELSFWSLVLIQDFVSNDLCTDELTSMPYLVKNFLSILKTREATFKSLVFKILSTLCKKREMFLQELGDNKAFLRTVSAALKSPNGLVVNYAIRFLTSLLQGGPTIVEKLLAIEEDTILDGLLHVAKESPKENKLLMAELLCEFVLAEKHVLQIVRNGAIDIIKELAKQGDDKNLTFFISAMLIDMAMISDAVKVEMVSACILPTIINWIKTDKNEKVVVFAAKTLVMLHRIEDTMDFTIRSGSRSTHITAGDVDFTDTQHVGVKIFHLQCLLSRDVCSLPIERNSISSPSLLQDQVQFSVPGLDNLKPENAGDIIFVSLYGRSGSKYVQGLLKYVKLSEEEQAQWSNRTEDHICVIIGMVDEDGVIHSLKTNIALTEAATDVKIPYMTLFQKRTIKHILPEILSPLAKEDWQVSCSLERCQLEVLNVLLCLDTYMDMFLQSIPAVTNLLVPVRNFNSLLSEGEARTVQAVLGILTTISTFDVRYSRGGNKEYSGRSILISLDVPQLLVTFLNSLLESVLQPAEPSPTLKNDVFDVDQVPVPPSVAAIINSLPPRPQSRAEPRSSRSSQTSETAEIGIGRQISSSVSSPLPAIPEDGFPVPEAAGWSTAESVQVPSVSSLIDEVIADVATGLEEKEPSSSNEESRMDAILENALVCLYKLVSGGSGSNSEQYRRMQNGLNKSGAVLTLWSHLLALKQTQKKLQVPIITTMTVISNMIHIDENNLDSRVRLDDGKMTRTMIMSADHLEVLNLNWTFESVRATVSVPRILDPSMAGTPEGWFYQMELLTNGLIQVGWANNRCKYRPRKGVGVGDDYDSYAFDGIRKKKWHGPLAEQTEDNNYGETWNVNDVVTCLFDRHGSVSYLLNEKDLGVAFKGADMREKWYPACSVCTDQWARFNFGDDPVRFAESIPPGFVPIAHCKNVSDASISDTDGKEEPQEAKEIAGEEELQSIKRQGLKIGPTEEGFVPVIARPLVTPSLPSLYFEVNIDILTARPFYIGYSTLESTTERIIAVMYHTNIMLPDQSTKQLQTQPCFVLGCGYTASTNSVFYTLDGDVIDMTFSFTNSGSVSKPMVPCLSSGRCRVNFGQEPFKYKMDDREEYLKGAISTCQRFLSICQESNIDKLG